MKCMLAGVATGALVVSAASADVTVTFENATWMGANFWDLTFLSGGFSGTLTGISVNATITGSSQGTFADDLCIYVDFAPLSEGGLLQVGGYDSFNAAEFISWSNGGSGAPGTTVIDTKTIANAISFSGTGADPIIWLGNGWDFPGAKGRWTGSITLIGLDEVPAPGAITLLDLAGEDAVPAPGAIALLGLAGLAGRRRR